MNTPRIVLCTAATLALLASSRGASAGGPNTAGFTDQPGDASLHRTDSALTAPLPSVVPDLLSVEVGGWVTPTPTSDPYNGAWDTGSDSDLLRIDLVIDGLVNPPGTFSPFDPDRFGSRPLVAFIEFDVDDNPDTGGECDNAVGRTRYLANVARFGALPFGVLSERAARNADAFDDNFNTLPRVELTGGDFLLSLCGCVTATVVDAGGDTSANTFDAGDTWIIRGRYFRRAGGYAGPSAIFGGTAPGEFDPRVNMRISHSIADDRTTVSLVFPLTMAGAAALTGEPEQAPDRRISNHTSVFEAIRDIVDSVDFTESDCEYELIRRWSEGDIPAAMQPSNWNTYAIIGVPYLVERAFPYAYTDVGFRETVADLDADGSVDATDQAAFDMWLAANDGSPDDADGAVNGSFGVDFYGPNFQLHDFTNNGVVDAEDAAVYDTTSPCPGDTNGDNLVNFTDVNTVLAQFGQMGPGLAGDLNGDENVDFNDVNEVLANLGTNCD